MHRKTVAMFPGNNIPVFRGNANAKNRFQELTVSCQEHVNPDIGYDEGNTCMIRKYAKFYCLINNMHTQFLEKIEFIWKFIHTQ